MWLSKTALTTSDAGAKFNENCITALTALVTSWTYLEKTDYATVPETLVSHTYGDCTAELKTRYGNSVPVKALLSSFDILVSRCQNGYYYYDDGWLNANIRGHANRKRDTTMASDSAIDLSSSSLVQWETPESPEPLPLAVGPLSNLDTSSGRKRGVNARDIAIRAAPGVFIKSREVGGTVFSMYRTTAFIEAGIAATVYTIEQDFPGSIARLLSGAMRATHTSVLRVGLSQHAGSTVNAIAFALQLSHGFSNWRELFNGMDQKGRQAIYELIAVALKNLRDHVFTGAVYRIYNGDSQQMVTIILNGVSGTVSSLASMELSVVLTFERGLLYISSNC